MNVLKSKNATMVGVDAKTPVPLVWLKGQVISFSAQTRLRKEKVLLEAHLLADIFRLVDKLVQRGETFLYGEGIWDVNVILEVLA